MVKEEHQFFPEDLIMFDNGESRYYVRVTSSTDVHGIVWGRVAYDIPGQNFDPHNGCDRDHEGSFLADAFTLVQYVEPAELFLAALDKLEQIL